MLFHILVTYTVLQKQSFISPIRIHEHIVCIMAPIKHTQSIISESLEKMASDVSFSDSDSESEYMYK
jgi:hypothetical protein